MLDRLRFGCITACPLAGRGKAATVALLETAMDFGTFLDKAWDDHVSVAREVAGRLPAALPLVTTEAQIVQLANLAQHVHEAVTGLQHVVAVVPSAK